MKRFFQLFKKKKSKNWRTQSRDLIIRNEFENFKRVFKDNIVTIILSSITVVTALSWQDALKTLIETFLPQRVEVYYKFYSAVILTLIAVLVISLLSKLKK